MARTRNGITSLLRRALVTMVVAQVGVIATLMGIDAWRKRVRPRSNKFPRVEPIDVDVRDSTTTIYTFGEDLYADMLAAIRGAKCKVLFESYIVKNDSLGEEFKQALSRRPSVASRSMSCTTASPTWWSRGSSSTSRRRCT